MKPVEMWLISYGLRCCALLGVEIACFLYVVPTLFNLHRDLADAGAAVIALVAVGGGLLWGARLSRELAFLMTDDDR